MADELGIDVLDSYVWYSHEYVVSRVLFSPADKNLLVNFSLAAYRKNINFFPSRDAFLCGYPRTPNDPREKYYK